MADKKKRFVHGLKCTETGEINYYFEKGKKNRPDRKKVEVSKFNRKLRRHTLHKEVKL